MMDSLDLTDAQLARALQITLTKETFRKPLRLDVIQYAACLLAELVGNVDDNKDD